MSTARFSGSRPGLVQVVLGGSGSLWTQGSEPLNRAVTHNDAPHMNTLPLIFPHPATASRSAAGRPVLGLRIRVAGRRTADPELADCRIDERNAPCNPSHAHPVILNDASGRGCASAAHPSPDLRIARPELDSRASTPASTNVFDTGDDSRSHGSWMFRLSSPIRSGDQRANGLAIRGPVGSTVRMYLRPCKQLIPATPGEGAAMAHQPLLTTRTLVSAQRARQAFRELYAEAHGGVVNLAAFRERLALLDAVEGDAEHADNCERYAEAVRRGASEPAYINRLRRNAGIEHEPFDAA